MTYFQNVLNDLPTDIQPLVLKRLEEWSYKNPFGQRVSRNIPHEHFLDYDSFKKLLEFIGDFEKQHPSKQWKKFEKEYRILCYNHVLKGGSIVLNYTPIFYGTSVEKQAFMKHLNDNYNSDFYNRRSREDFAIRLSQGKISPFKKFIRLKRFSVWSTWNMEQKKGMPYDYCKTDEANEVRAAMGLRMNDAKTELYIFAYTLPTPIVPIRATIADAELNEYFEPPALQETISHTSTVTWKLLDDFARKKYYPHPRPECVHQSITFDDIILPVVVKR